MARSRNSEERQAAFRPVLVEYRAPRRFAAVLGSAPAVPGGPPPDTSEECGFRAGMGYYTAAPLMLPRTMSFAGSSSPLFQTL